MILPASWEMNSCAAWLSWKCQMSSGTAREHVRVARALRDLPVIREEFAAARLSYAKVLGCRRRRPNAALRRAARERDTCRCRFPGCESRRVGLHHIQFWSHGGRTDLDNLISLCKYHHLLVHERGYLIAAKPGGSFAFYRPDGTALPPSPPLPKPAGTIADCHDAEITEDTIIPAWYASGSTWTTPSTPAWPMLAARRSGGNRPWPPPAIASRSSNQTAGPTGYASTTTSAPPHDRPRQNSGGPAARQTGGAAPAPLR